MNPGKLPIPTSVLGLGRRRRHLCQPLRDPLSSNCRTLSIRFAVIVVITRGY